MAIIYEDALKAQLKLKNTLPVYVIAGDDGYLKQLYVDKIISLSADKDDVFNFQRFNSGCDLQEVYDSLSQLPVMADKKCAVLCDYDFEHCSKSELEKLYLLASDTADTAVLIIWFDSLEFDVKKSAKFKKLVSSAEKGGGAAVLLNHRKTPELVKMLETGAAKRECRFGTGTARYLVEAAGDDIAILKNELEKLCAYKQGGIIEKDDVDKVCIKTPEASVYNLSKWILARDAGQALSVLDELFFMRLEPMMILYTVSSVYVDMYRLYVTAKKGMKISETAALFGYKGREFVLERAAQNLKKMDFKRLLLSFNALILADKGLKTAGADPRTVLEQLTVRLIYIIAKGETVDQA